MTFRALVACAIVFAGSLSIIVWLNRSADIARQDELKRNPPNMGTKEDQEEYDRIRLAGAPPVSPQGPHPKVILSEKVFSFGQIAVKEQKRHKFIIRNEGAATLKLVAGKRSCQCTTFTIKDTEVPPGGATEVELVWEGENFSSSYEEQVHILTNDPEYREIILHVAGGVGFGLALGPVQPWRFGEVRGDKPMTLQGYIGIPDKGTFKILKIESSSPHLKAGFAEMPAEELAKTKCPFAYQLTAELSPNIPTGQFKAKFTIHTDLPNGQDDTGTTMFVAVEALKPGSYRTLSASNGCRWFPDTKRLDLGPFEAAKGKFTMIPMLVDDRANPPLEFVDVQSDGKYVKVSLTPAIGEDTRVGDRRRYDLKFEVPPGSPAEGHRESNPVTIRVKTNRPDIPELDFYVYYVSD